MTGFSLKQVLGRRGPRSADGRGCPLEEHVDSRRTPRSKSLWRVAVGLGLELAVPASSVRCQFGASGSEKSKFITASNAHRDDM
jgi:hypothetical protein